MGEQVDVRLKFRGLKKDFVDAVALIDLLPGGFELVVPQSSVPPEEMGEYAGWECQICIGGTPAMLQYADMREDRVVFYVNASRELAQIVYRIKATNVGTYVVPPAYGEAMYDTSIIARSAAGRIAVSRP